MKKKLSVVSTLILMIVMLCMFGVAVTWFIAPIFSVAGYKWAQRIMQLFFEIGLYK